MGVLIRLRPGGEFALLLPLATRPQRLGSVVSLMTQTHKESEALTSRRPVGGFVVAVQDATLVETVHTRLSCRLAVRLSVEVGRGGRGQVASVRVGPRKQTWGLRPLARVVLRVVVVAPAPPVVALAVALRFRLE